jgi:DNA-binding IclR family transcriptional regulator
VAAVNRSNGRSSTSLDGGVRPVKSAERTLAVLEYLSSSEEPRSLRETAEELKIPRASAYALLTTMVHSGWVEVTGGEYRLGVRSLRVGASFIESDSMVHQAEPVIESLSRRLNETIHLARLDHDEVVYMVTKPSQHSLSIVIRPGRRMPAWATALGKAMLAEWDWPDVEDLLPDEMPALTAKTLSTREALAQDLKDTLRRGYAIDDEESSIGLRCFAVAVGAERPPVYALSCPVPMARLDPEREAEIAEAMLGARATLVPSLGRMAL